ncbi:MAG: hypothetical protein MUE98_08710 [Rhodobacteraceae bacterium]|jgi:hypothetical protein|nr:hypothetical protein [Paracoccaceae bacterium]
MLQPIQYALPGIAQVRAPVAAETASAVPGAAESDRTGNDVPRERGAEAERLAREARDLLDDPRRPVGPPPAFQANVLEAERARLKAAEPAPQDRDEGADGGAATASQPAEPGPGEPFAAASVYAEAAAEEPPHELDLSR